MSNLSSVVKTIYVCLNLNLYCSIMYNSAWKKPIAYTVKSTAFRKNTTVTMAFMKACVVKIAVTSYTISLPLNMSQKALTECVYIQSVK